MIWYIIPAREGSKGFPHKNRILFKYTAEVIICSLSSKIIVSTDDKKIMEMVNGYKFLVHERSYKNSDDTASMKDTLIEIIKDYNIDKDDTICLLYLTYPGRTNLQITEAITFFNSLNAKSMLCKKEIKTHPYLCMYNNGIYGKQVVEHNLYRRQDYPECFEISHYIGIFKAEEIKNLNSNLYNSDTIFFDINDVIDIDTQNDFERFING